MGVIRYENGNTGENEQAIIDIIRSENTKKVTLFATPTECDEPDPNLPLMSVLAEYEIPGAGLAKIVYDGLFLTAARRPRYLEVKHVLDIAESSEKAYFSKERVPFTSTMTPEEAAITLESVEEVDKLTPSTRASYFAMLSSLSEENFN